MDIKWKTNIKTFLNEIKAEAASNTHKVFADDSANKQVIQEVDLKVLI